MENIEPNINHDDLHGWREKFINYYETNVPSRVSMVNDTMMSKWNGKYEILMANLVKKYGPLASPIAIDIDHSSQSRRSSGSSKIKKSSIAELSSTFKTLISKVTSTLPRRDMDADIRCNVVESKASNTENGLETSTFTVCTRVRPLLGHELAERSEDFAAVVPGYRTETKMTSEVGSTMDDNYNHNHTEELLLHVPKISVRGEAKLDSKSYLFDYTFGPDSTNQEIYDLACAPLVKRALNGQIGVMFAYGQTGSGKTHTMSGILDILSTSDIFSEKTDVTFSYMEMLGRNIKDCLPDEHSKDISIKIGEALNGAVLIRNMATHSVKNASQLAVLIKRANSIRATAITTKNDSSSRSHGVALLKVKNKKTAVEGTLYVIDLAGSESAYRRNKLTLLMKDVFDIGCSRLCSTVVIAACSPLASDIDHTTSTVKYAAPLRVALAAIGSNRQKNFELDVHDPALWSNEKIVSWVERVVAETGTIDAKLFVNGLTGVQFCALPENKFYERAEAQLKEDDDEGDMMEIAKTLYLGLWTLIADAKTRKRRPDGSIITPEAEEEERRKMEIAAIEKKNVWAEREKHLKA